MDELIKSLTRRLEAEGWFWRLYMAFGWTRFSHSLVSDVLWYASPTRKFILSLTVGGLLWVAWLFRPWFEIEGEIKD